MRGFAKYGVTAAVPFVILLAACWVFADSVCPPYTQSAGTSPCTSGLPPTFITNCNQVLFLTDCGQGNSAYSYKQDVVHNWNGTSAPAPQGNTTYVGQIAATTCYTRYPCQLNKDLTACENGAGTAFSSNPYDTLDCP